MDTGHFLGVSLILHLDRTRPSRTSIRLVALARMDSCFRRGKMRVTAFFQRIDLVRISAR